MEEGVVTGSHISIDIYPLPKTYVKYLYKLYTLCNRGDLLDRFSQILLGIWVVLCQHVPSVNPLGPGVLVYANEVTKESVHKCEEASFMFPYEVSLEKKKACSLCAY